MNSKKIGDNDWYFLDALADDMGMISTLQGDLDIDYIKQNCDKIQMCFTKPVRNITGLAFIRTFYPDGRYEDDYKIKLSPTDSSETIDYFGRPLLNIYGSHMAYNYATNYNQMTLFNKPLYDNMPSQFCQNCNDNNDNDTWF